MWSLYGHVVAPAVFFLVHSCLSHLMVGLLGVGSLALQQSLARSDVVRVVVMPVSVLVGCARVGLGTMRRVTLSVVVWRRVDAVCCARCIVGRPARAQPVALSRCCLGLVEGGLLGVCFVVPGALCWCAVGLAGWCLAWVVVVWAACRRAWLGLGWWCLGQRHVRLVLLVRRRLRLLSVGVLGLLSSAVGLRLRLSCLRVLCCCLSARVVVRGVVVLGLGCRCVCRLAAGVVGFGLVVLVVVF